MKMKKILFATIFFCYLGPNALIASYENEIELENFGKRAAAPIIINEHNTHHTFLNLPDDCLQIVMNGLDIRSWGRFSQTCKRFNGIPVDPTHWKLAPITVSTARGIKIPPSACILRVESTVLGRSYPQVINELPLGLMSLDFSNCNIGSPGAKLLGSRGFEKITILNLSKAGLCAESINDLGPLLKDTLTSLNLSQNPIGDQGVINLAKYPLSGLRSLNLGYTTMDDDTTMGDPGVNALDTFLKAGLQDLDISGNFIGNQGVTTFSKLSLAKLTSLGLRLCGIGDEGAQALVAKLQPGLKRLNLSENRILHSRNLAFSPRLLATLEVVDLRGNQIVKMMGASMETMGATIFNADPLPPVLAKRQPIDELYVGQNLDNIANEVRSTMKGFKQAAGNLWAIMKGK